MDYQDKCRVGRKYFNKLKISEYLQSQNQIKQYIDVCFVLCKANLIEVLITPISMDILRSYSSVNRHLNKPRNLLSLTHIEIQPWVSILNACLQRKVASYCRLRKVMKQGCFQGRFKARKRKS